MKIAETAELRKYYKVDSVTDLLTASNYEGKYVSVIGQIYWENGDGYRLCDTDYPENEYVVLMGIDHIYTAIEVDQNCCKVEGFFCHEGEFSTIQVTSIE